MLSLTFFGEVASFELQTALILHFSSLLPFYSSFVQSFKIQGSDAYEVKLVFMVSPSFYHWDYCNHRIMLRSVLILLQSPTSHLPLRVSVWSSLHRHIFLVALDTHLDTKPSVAIRGLLFPGYFCPFLFPLTKRLFCVVQDLVMRNAPPPIPARGGRKKELANCFALG